MFTLMYTYSNLGCLLVFIISILSPRALPFVPTRIFSVFVMDAPKGTIYIKIKFIPNYAEQIPCYGTNRAPSLLTSCFTFFLAKQHM